MAKGNPNDDSMKLNFVAKVRDPISNSYKPVYIAPDATTSIRGDVYLSDAVDGTEIAATGVTAATPKAVKTVNDNANTKLSKEETEKQTVKSAVDFEGIITGKIGMKVPSPYYFDGNLSGKADSAGVLDPGASITVKSGNMTSSASATFTGASNIELIIPKLDGTTVEGVVPLASVPEAGALNPGKNIKITAGDSVSSGTALFDGKSDIEIKIPEIDADIISGIVGEAAKLNPGKTIEIIIGADVSSGSALFTGENNITITVPEVDGRVVKGTVPQSAKLDPGAKIIIKNGNAENAEAIFTGENDTEIELTEIDGSLIIGDKLGTQTFGDENTPIYLNEGVVTEVTPLHIIKL